MMTRPRSILIDGLMAYKLSLLCHKIFPESASLRFIQFLLTITTITSSFELRGLAELVHAILTV